MTGLELLRNPETTAEEIADIVSAQCPPIAPKECDRVGCPACWLAWLTTGEMPNYGEPPAKLPLNDVITGDAPCQPWDKRGLTNEVDIYKQADKKQIKCKRDATTLDVMEYVVADAHTFDLWVQYTAPNGKVKAIRPVVVAWEDIRSRCILGPVVCEHSNAQVVKESVVKMVYSELGGVPKHAHTDNGKDFTPNEMLGQNRKERTMRQDVKMDSETIGFLRSIGVEKWTRSLPYQPWGKPIERAFGTFCLRFSRKYKSYVGTLTASKTEAKRKKDIDGMGTMRLLSGHKVER